MHTDFVPVIILASERNSVIKSKKKKLVLTDGMLSYFRIQQQHKLFLLLSEVQVVRKVYHQPNRRLSYLQNQCNSVLKKLSNASNKNIDQPSTNQNRDYFSLILRNCPKQICEVPPK